MTLEEKKAKYMELCHAMQTGVAFTMEIDPAETTPKHLRVGVNSAMCDTAALAKLLFEKGVITEDEYFDKLIVQMTEEVETYRVRLAQHYGNGTTFDLI